MCVQIIPNNRNHYQRNYWSIEMQMNRIIISVSSLQVWSNTTHAHIGSFDLLKLIDWMSNALTNIKINTLSILSTIELYTCLTLYNNNSFHFFPYSKWKQKWWWMFYTFAVSFEICSITVIISSSDTIKRCFFSHFIEEVLRFTLWSNCICIETCFLVYSCWWEFIKF